MRNSAPRLRARRRAALACLLGAPWVARPAPAVALALTLADRLPRALAACGLPLPHLGLEVQAVEGPVQALASLNAEQPFVLASTAKLVTALAALDLLGPRWRWRTHAFATGPLRGGRLQGDLLVVGGGDPRLTTDELRRWLAELRAKGLDEVQGDLVVDRSAFVLHAVDHQGTPDPAPDRPHHARPDALAIDGATAPDPREHLARTWREVGGGLRGRVREGDLSRGRLDAERLPFFGPDGEPVMPLATLLSPPLPEVVRDINKASNNLAARQLMLSLARGFPVRPATLPAARERVAHWLQRQGLAPGDLELDNGSGLSRAERGRPRALVRLLRRAWAGEVSREFIDSLPVAGVDGTLAHRLQGGAAAGRAWLKTGSLLDARALAGFVQARSGRWYAMAAFVNHPQAAGATPALDAVVEQLAQHG